MNHVSGSFLHSFFVVLKGQNPMSFLDLRLLRRRRAPSQRAFSATVLTSRPYDDMAVTVLVLYERVDSDLTGGTADKGDAAYQNKAVGEIRAALECEVVDGCGSHRESCMAARAGAGHFVDPGDELPAEQPSCGIDILIPDHIYILNLGEFHAPLGTGIAGSVIRSGIAESCM